MTRLQVPDLHFPFLICSVTRSGGQALTVRAEGYTPHNVRVFPLKEGCFELTLKDLLQIPDLRCHILASRGEVPAVAAKHDAGGIRLVSLPLPEFLSGFRLPDRDNARLSARGQELAIAAERQADDRAVVAQGRESPVPQPLEVVPFPAAQVGWALLEQRFHPAQVVRGPLAVRQGNALEVELGFEPAPGLRFRRRQVRRCLGAGLRGPCLLLLKQQCAGHQRRHRHSNH